LNTSLYTSSGIIPFCIIWSNSTRNSVTRLDSPFPVSTVDVRAFFFMTILSGSRSIGICCTVLSSSGGVPTRFAFESAITMSLSRASLG